MSPQFLFYDAFRDLTKIDDSSSYLMAEASSGQNIVDVQNGSAFQVGYTVQLWQTSPSSLSEFGIVASISGDRLYMEENLQNTYAISASVDRSGISISTTEEKGYFKDDSLTEVKYISSLSQWDQGVQQIELHLEYDTVVRATLSTDASVGQNTLSVDDGSNFVSGSRGWALIRNATGTVKEHKTYYAVASNIIYLDETLLQRYPSGSTVEEISWVPSISLVREGAQESFSEIFYEIDLSTRDVDGSISRDYYRLTFNEPLTDLIVMLHGIRKDSSITPSIRNYACFLSK